MKLVRSLTKPTLNKSIFPSAGVVLIDKPSGITSHDVVNQIRKATGIKKIGHAGTLDPLATGLLVILISREFTKRQSSFLKRDKQYMVTGRLGIVTDSYDIDGKVVKEMTKKEEKEKLEKISREEIEEALAFAKESLYPDPSAY